MEKKTKLPKVTHQGMVDINGFQIRCYNLDNGERVLSREGFLRALGRVGNPKYKENRDLFITPVFLRANNLNPFISEELVTSSQPIEFELTDNRRAYGYRANILPAVCYVYLDADKAGVLADKQKIVAEQCEMLVRGFATLGIIALVDEATGYQYERESDELQKILKAYIAEELMPWQKKFPDVYYKELFRLNGWDFTVKGIKKRPGVIGTWTNKLVYEQLPPGVLKELKKNTPKSAAGNYTHRFFQGLSMDVGNPHLTAQINQVVTLFQLSDTMNHMWNQFEKLKARQNGILELPFMFDEYGHTIEPVESRLPPKLSDFNASLKKAANFDPRTKDTSE